MARSRRRPEEEPSGPASRRSRSGARLDPGAADPEGKPGTTPSGRRSRSGMEAFFQEFVRRTATAGLSGFFLTEEALRRAVGDVVPREWVSFAAEQSNEMRREVLDRLAREFGEWLRSLDAEELQRTVLRTLLEHYDLSIHVELSAEPREGNSGASLELVSRKKSTGHGGKPPRS